MGASESFEVFATMFVAQVKSGWISGSNLTLHYSKCKTLRERMAGTEYARQYATKHGESATAPPRSYISLFMHSGTLPLHAALV